MSQICHRISKEPGKDISQSMHELHSKNRGIKNWNSHDRPFFNELTPNPKSWFMKLIQFHSLAVLLQMHVHPLPRIKAPVKYLDLPKRGNLETLGWAWRPGKLLSLALKVAHVRPYLTFSGGLLYCRTVQARKGPHLWYCTRWKTPSQKLGSIVYASCLYTGNLRSQVCGQTHMW